MPHDITLIATIAAGFGLAMIFGLIAVRLRMPPLVGAILIVLQLLFTYAAPMQQLFRSTALDLASWALILGLGAAVFVAVEIEKAVLRHFRVTRL